MSFSKSCILSIYNQVFRSCWKWLVLCLNTRPYQWHTTPACMSLCACQRSMMISLVTRIENCLWQLWMSILRELKTSRLRLSLKFNKLIKAQKHILWHYPYTRPFLLYCTNCVIPCQLYLLSTVLLWPLVNGGPCKFPADPPSLAAHFQDNKVHQLHIAQVIRAWVEPFHSFQLNDYIIQSLTSKLKLMLLG